MILLRDFVKIENVVDTNFNKLPKPPTSFTSNFVNSIKKRKRKKV